MVLDLGGRAVPLRVRRNRRARRIVLRIDAETDGAVVTLPPRVAIAEGIDLARRKAAWIAARLDALPARVPFADGARVPLLDVDHRVRHRPEARRGVWREAGEIHVSGPAEHLARRLRDWLGREARAQIAPRVAERAARIDRRAGRIALRDTRSRWGSCSATGNLSFCWRLVLAPVEVLDYVVAHEVAHLAVMDHGPAFWATVRRLVVADPDAARRWLQRNGPRLHRYG